MRRLDDLPDAFPVSAGRAAGWAASTLDSARFERPFHGVRQVPSDEPLSPLEAHIRRVVAFASAASAEEFVSHISAAAAWGMPLPPGLPGDDIDISVLLPLRSPRGRGVRGHAVAEHLVTVVEHPSLALRIADPATTWAMLGALLWHPYDLVAAGDAIVRVPQHPHDPAALTTIAALEAAVRAGRRVGVHALRAALPRIRTGASSRPETWVRLLLVDTGLPEPVAAHEVFDGDGRFVARLDLAYPRRRVAVEYEGEQHLTDPAQWARDIRRYEALAALGWTVIRLTREDLHGGSAAARVRRALAAARG
ncbi:DUF559 domain-containing protein [Microbacterium sp. 10M-3C3]|jgi:hypothetical protein|uniref:endonuclease domain-containing protein n=1 Tax=Microbacterium sp. 10M-3C3 TaxID=2483401 RepID=UPI000F637DBE|nr:DUF559 domain-containing protein [Microbacterium sp. 10M-3C3]